MPVVIDGNNLVYGSAGSGGRGELRRKALEAVRKEGFELTVVFDGPPPEGAPPIEHLGRVTVRYAAPKTADEVIVKLIPNGTGAGAWVVVTDDRELQREVRRRGANVRSLAEWRRRKVKRPRRTTHESKLSSHEVADWEAYFSRRDRDD